MSPLSRMPRARRLITAASLLIVSACASRPPAISFLTPYGPPKNPFSPAVRVGSQACAFVGRSGAGKSTMAAAMAAIGGGEIISDDCLVLHPRAGAWWAMPSGAGVRLWPSTLDLLGVLSLILAIVALGLT